MKLVSSQIVGAGGAATVTFSAIPQTGTDLIILYSQRITAGSSNYIFAYLNSNTASNYGWIYEGFEGSAWAFSSTTGAAGLHAGYTAGTDIFASSFASNKMVIPNYTSTAIKEAYVNSYAATFSTSPINLITLATNSADTTAAITSITFSAPSTRVFAQYSMFSLYTVTKGSGGATTSP